MNALAGGRKSRTDAVDSNVRSFTFVSANRTLRPANSIFLFRFNPAILLKRSSVRAARI